MKNKYSNRKIEYEGKKFDSRLEGRRYCQLRDMLAAGEIKNLVLQPRFELQPPFKKGNKTYRNIEYVADFMYEDWKGNKIVEDVKGYSTDVFRLKQKIFEYQNPKLTLVLIKKERMK